MRRERWPLDGPVHRPRKHWHVLSEDGVAYRVGLWKDGLWHPGTFRHALREVRSLRRQGERRARLVRLPYRPYLEATR